MPGNKSRSPEQMQEDRNALYSILLQPDTKQALQELYSHMSRKDNEYLWSYDALIFDMIRVY
jgi:hypothetical protein